MMKVLFVSSRKDGGLSCIVKNQGESLRRAGLQVDFTTTRPGLLGYLASVPGIRKSFKRGRYDLVHAHYSFSGFTAALAGCRPLVVSLMGSDVYMSAFWRIIIRLFSRYVWNVTIVKTEAMRKLLSLPEARVMPNGVDTDRFRPLPKADARMFIGFPEDRKILLFVSIPGRREKNIELAQKAMEALNDENIMLKHIYDIPNEEMPYYYNAADLLLITSIWEGSVNVVKEALACNCPVVATDVGDVKWLTEQVRNCHIAGFDPLDVADKIRLTLNMKDNSVKSNGRERIYTLGLSSGDVSSCLIKLYEESIRDNRSGKI